MKREGDINRWWRLCMGSRITLRPLHSNETDCIVTLIFLEQHHRTSANCLSIVQTKILIQLLIVSPGKYVSSSWSPRERKSFRVCDITSLSHQVYTVGFGGSDPSANRAICMVGFFRWSSIARELSWRQYKSTVCCGRRVAFYARVGV